MFKKDMEAFKFQINSKGFLINRESYDLEYKQSFHFGDSLLDYLRSMVGMANNKGGRILFGIQNSPRLPIGLTNNKFQELDPNRINQIITEYFSHDFDWEISSLEFENKEFGQISVSTCKYRPIICRKTFKSILREGAIYYRYRGETKEIKYTELARLLESQREKERKLWLSHIDRISQVGPENIHILDTYNGELTHGNERILIAPELLDKLKFIQEGTFVETGGEPTLTLAGKIIGTLDNSGFIPTDKAYPYRMADIERIFNLNRYQVSCLIWKLNVKGNSRYHDEIKIGKNSFTNKYSESLIKRISSILERYPEYIENSCEEFQYAKRQSK